MKTFRYNDRSDVIMFQLWPEELKYHQSNIANTAVMLGFINLEDMVTFNLADIAGVSVQMYAHCSRMPHKHCILSNILQVNLTISHLIRQRQIGLLFSMPHLNRFALNLML